MQQCANSGRNLSALPAVEGGKGKERKELFFNIFSTTQPSSHGAVPAGPGHWAGKGQEDETEGRRLLTQGWDVGEITGCRYLLSDNAELGAGKDWEEPGRASACGIYGQRADNTITAACRALCQVAPGRWTGAAGQKTRREDSQGCPGVPAQWDKAISRIILQSDQLVGGDLIFQRYCGDLEKQQVCQAS